ncbi:MAG: MASE1 domain-containing protein [Rhodospirillaceae bacterium]|nr:MASE1 domain-containing protein [Rhodospirillales bacterium]
MRPKLIRLALAAAFLAAYVALDQISFIHSFSAINITPWNPPPALGLAALILAGPRMAPLFFAATIAADLLVRDLPAPLWASVAGDGVIVAIYAAGAMFLRRFVRLDIQLGGLRDVLWLLAVAVMGAAAVAPSYVALFVLGGVVPPDAFASAATRYWIGDMIGIAVLTPAILLFRQRPKLPAPRVLGEMALQGCALAGALWLVFGLEASANFQFFYLLFPPLIWAAARFGLKGAVLGNMAAQLGLIVVFRAEDSDTVTTFQFLMLALAMATLVLGAAISERRRVQTALHARQDELAQMSRLSMAGEMAAALAHELNQPLLAAIAFTRAAQRLLAAEPSELAKARGAMDRAVAESQRAGDIIRSLREFIGTGRAAREPASVSALVGDALALAAPECARRGIRLVTLVDKLLPAIHVDRVQLQQVLVNLIRNGMDAMGQGGEITVAAWAEHGGMEFLVTDTGPGLSEDVAGNLFEPFNTSKATGMGLGLAISRSFVEAHGGKLWLERTGPGGAAFRFSLPLTGESKGEHN